MLAGSVCWFGQPVRKPKIGLWSGYPVLFW